MTSNQTQSKLVEIIPQEETPSLGLIKNSKQNDNLKQMEPPENTNQWSDVLDTVEEKLSLPSFFQDLESTLLYEPDKSSTLMARAAVFASSKFTPFSVYVQYM